MIHSRDDIKSTYKRAVNGFEIKTFTDWQSRHQHWYTTSKGKNYIIFRFTDDKKIYQLECPENILRRLTQTRAIPMLQNIGVSDEKIAEIGNYSKWWIDQWGAS